MPDASASRPRPGTRGISEALREWVEEIALERGSILDFVEQIAASAPPGERVLDLGAGDAPYRELFEHTAYRTSDWERSLHAGARSADIVAPAWALPLEDESVGLILCTQTLEHVPEPARAPDECFRLLTPGGRLALTVPLAWEPHELPHDYYRYTEPGIRHLLTSSGFVDIETAPRTDGFTTLAQLMLNLSYGLEPATDGLDAERDEARGMLRDLSARLVRLAPLDVGRGLTLGYTATARRP